mmetsp:Transcript_6676/g.16346  ORF Transcript_6676/g.16346 Transcript_6676/m.16346 type:complete len:206 (+) Transcript_6676:105-722(+)
MDGGHGSVDGKLFLGTTKKIEGALFMAPPNHPFLKEVMGVQFRVLESQFWPSVHATGPAAFREAYQTSSSEVVLIPEVHMNTGKRLSSFKGAKEYRHNNRMIALHLHVGHWGWSATVVIVLRIIKTVAFVVGIMAVFISLIETTTKKESNGEPARPVVQFLSQYLGSGLRRRVSRAFSNLGIAARHRCGDSFVFACGCCRHWKNR